MKKDITQLPVKDIKVAVCPRNGDLQEELWDVFLINEGSRPITNVLISSRGYGVLDGREKITTTLRYFHESMSANSNFMIEPIQSSLFGINNEYWVSFNQGEHILDKKFTLLANSVSTTSLVFIPKLEKKGFLID